MTTTQEKKKRILVVDDNTENIRVIGSILRQQGYNAGFAMDGQQALEILKGSIEEFDLMLLDVNMPGMNGFDVCREIRLMERFDELPVIFLTANTETAQIVEGFSSGGQDYVTKPFQADELLARISTHLELREKRALLKQMNELLNEKVRERTRELEESNQKLVRAYRELRKLDESKAVFLRLISHEINTPLNGVIGFADFLKEQLVSTEYFTMIEKLSESAHRLNDFAQSSLIITRMRTTPDEYGKTMIDLKDVVDDILISNRELVDKKNIRVDLFWNATDATIPANHELMTLCLNHLFRNALQHTPDNGSIAIACRTGDSRQILSFEDSGPGFSERSFENMFKPLSTADELIDNHKGLGLSIVKLIADFHEAGIQISNRPEGGARVELRFPKYEGSGIVS
ncbi:hybrid sensor histidine kinase/response regulator [Dysgonomonadaceae bacterium zrk40]|nr:hybrid sensor histidine kinase/response regulator [Dysgonomonadaceae bacterium zrk40]